MSEFTLRPMKLGDITSVPVDCQGGRVALMDRINDLGSAAILAFEGDKHVGQLQFRRYDPSLRSKEGIWNPDYWGDFGEKAPSLPQETLGVFCFHVGQVEPGDDRDEKYFGRGMGIALLDYLIDWTRDQGFKAIVAKHTPADRSVMAFMGGQPSKTYEDRGFENITSWVDLQLFESVIERKLADTSSDPANVASVGVCVKHFA
jgi:GNAT superfamily N-acetyltransferase